MAQKGKVVKGGKTRRPLRSIEVTRSEHRDKRYPFLVRVLSKEHKVLDFEFRTAPVTIGEVHRRMDSRRDGPHEILRLDILDKAAEVWKTVFSAGRLEKDKRRKKVQKGS